jgi:hypothetical protein
MNTNISPSVFLEQYLAGGFNPYAANNISSQPLYDLAGNPFGPDFQIKGTSKNTGRQPLMPGESEEVRKIYGPKFYGDAFDITPGAGRIQLPPA